MQEGNLIADEHPAPHRRCVVKRDGKFFTATPCYGMHAPWWVVATMTGEADPEPMRDSDEWWSLAEFPEKYEKGEP